MTGLSGSVADGSVTVVTVYYNRADGVAESLASLLEQDYPRLRIVVVDDCSTDDTAERIAEAVAHDRRVEFVRNAANKGFTRSLIDVLAAVETEFVAIHGSGDISHPGRISAQVALLQERPRVGVTSQGRAADRGRGLTFHDTQALIRKNRITHGAAMFRMAAYREAGGYRSFFTTRQDRDLWLRMSLTWEVCATPEKLYTPINRKASVSYTDYQSMLPTLMSAFAVDQIRKRIVRGFDDIDRFGNQGALLFDPRKSNAAIVTAAFVRVRGRQFMEARRYVEAFIRFNHPSLSSWALKIFIVPGLRLIESFYGWIRNV